MTEQEPDRALRAYQEGFLQGLAEAERRAPIYWAKQRAAALPDPRLWELARVYREAVLLETGDYPEWRFATYKERQARDLKEMGASR